MEHAIRYPSLELNWLPNSLRKTIPTPKMVITDCPHYGGAITITKEGPLIEISEVCDSFEGTIAHEWRHLWQLYNGFLGQSGSHWLSLFSSPDTYKDAIISYFHTQSWEMDALIFERKFAKTELTELWWEWLI